MKLNQRTVETSNNTANKPGERCGGPWSFEIECVKKCVTELHGATRAVRLIFTAWTDLYLSCVRTGFVNSELRQACTFVMHSHNQWMTWRRDKWKSMKQYRVNFQTFSLYWSSNVFNAQVYFACFWFSRDILSHDLCVPTCIYTCGLYTQACAQQMTILS